MKNESRLLYLQAKYQFDKAMKKFEDGSIKSEPQLIQTVFESFQDFFTQMGKPNMISRYVSEGGPPWSEDYNNMMEEIKEDLEILYQELDILGKSLFTSFNHNIMQNEILEKEYENVYDQLKDLETYVNLSGEGVIRFGRDDFLNGLRIDWDRISETPLEITPTGVTLPILEQRNVAQDAKVTIVPGNQKHDDYILGSDSNGFPGNNHEVTKVSDSLLTGTFGYQFVGRNDNRGNYGAVIDGDPNTWFEYERVNLRDHEKIKIAKNYGWEYVVSGNKKLYFAEDPENGVLKLHLQIVLDKEEIINQINIDMYTPPNYGSQTAIVKNILVSSEYGAPKSVIHGRKQDNEYSFHFEPTKAKVISILFEQKHKYYTDLGHIYYEKKMSVESETDYVFETLEHRKRPEFAPRLDGPLISLEELGVKVDVDETQVKAYYPFRQREGHGYPLDDIVNDLIKQVDESTVDAGIERFEGYRYAIGIRNIEIFSVEFAPKGELVTTPYYFDKPVERISISAKETLENLIAKNSNIKYDWISYYVSIDDGKEWYPITPLERTSVVGGPPKVYTIQQIDSEDEKIEDRYGYIESTHPVYSLRLKVVIERPDDYVETLNDEEVTELSDYSSSTLQKFTFQVETKPLEDDTDSVSLSDMMSEVEYEGIYDPGFQIDDEIPDEEDDKEIEEPPPSGRYDDYEPIILDITSYPEEICRCDPMIIRGIASSSQKINSIKLYINNVEVDPFNLGNPVEVEGCTPVENLTSENNDLNNDGSQVLFEWIIPYWKIYELGSDLGDAIQVQITAEDDYSVDRFYFNANIVDCTIDTRDCLELESVVVQYYNESMNDIAEIELDKDLLPYEFDNGEGTLVTVGWDEMRKAPVIMVTGGYNETGYAFQLHAVGVRYIDYDNESKIKWSTAILEESENTLNTELIPGDPEEKDKSWVEDIYNGNYRTAPTLQGLNSWIIVRIDDEFISGSCPINLENFDPNEHQVDTEPPNNQDRDVVNECNTLHKIVFQYYDLEQDKLLLHTVKLNEEVYKPVHRINSLKKNIDVLVGWYNKYQSPLIKVEEASGDNNLLLTAVGVLYQDVYNDLLTDWMIEVDRRTAYVFNKEKMGGSLKSYPSYLEEVKQGNFKNAPILSRKGAAIVGKFSEKLTESICILDGIDNHPSTPSMVDNKPEIIIHTNIPDTIYYQELEDQKLNLKGLLKDDYGLINWQLSMGDFRVGDNNMPDLLEKPFDIDLTIPFPEPIERTEEYSPKVDIIFVIDTSQSMQDNIDNVKANLNSFINYLERENLDVHLGYVCSGFTEEQQRMNMTPAKNFSLDSVFLDTNAWEGLRWRQITDTTYGAASLYHQLRPDAKTHIVMLTDTHITEDLTQDIIDDLKDRNITVSVIWEIGIDDEPDYEWLAEETGGLSLDLNNPKFYEEMEELAQLIVETTYFYPDTTQVITITAEDSYGHITTRNIILNLRDITTKVG